MSSNVAKKAIGHLPDEIWDKFIKGDKGYKGYYTATCSYCFKTWTPGKSKDLKKHLAYEYQKQIRLIKLVLGSNVSFVLIEHPFFYDFTKALHSTYSFSSHWVLPNTLFDQELAQINLRVDILYHTDIFLDNELIEIVKKIEPEKLAVVVSDNGSNVCVA
ncbi:1170_t:CDS:2, partial [Dentiscutata heterogama]